MKMNQKIKVNRWNAIKEKSEGIERINSEKIKLNSQKLEELLAYISPIFKIQLNTSKHLF